MNTPAITTIFQTTRTTLVGLLVIWILGASLLTADAAEAVVGAAEAQTVRTSTSDLQPASASPHTNPDNKDSKTSFETAMGLVIALVAIVMGIGVGFFGIWYDYRKRRDLITVCHQERMAALDKGLDLPPFPDDLLCDVNRRDDRSKPVSPFKGLKSGLTWLGIGIGLAIFLSFQEGRDVHPAVGAIPIGIGMARLIGYAIERRKTSTGANRA